MEGEAGIGIVANHAHVVASLEPYELRSRFRLVVEVLLHDSLLLR